MTFNDEEVSKADVTNSLLNDEVVTDADQATEIVENAWVELGRRAELASNLTPYSVGSRRLVRVRSWEKVPENAFCILLSAACLYTFRAYDRGLVTYEAQGRLFESLTAESLSSWGWSVAPTGWGKDNPAKLEERLLPLTDSIRERPGGNRGEYIPKASKDGGLDILLSRTFGDDWCGRPVYLVQCASGWDWENKLATPSIGLWCKLVDFPSPPQRALAFPFAVREVGMRKITNAYGGLLLDRFRILRARRDGPVSFSPGLREALARWMPPLVDEILALTR